MTERNLKTYQIPRIPSHTHGAIARSTVRRQWNAWTPRSAPHTRPTSVGRTQIGVPVRTRGERPDHDMDL